jgi:3-phosphoshikimate 1-carboxyvinyltransferase
MTLTASEKTKIDEVLKVTPGRPLQGVVPLHEAGGLPGDKSLSHRAALFAALADGESRIDNFQVSGVTRAMLRALSALGVDWELQGTSLRVSGTGLTGLREPDQPIDCGNSATTIRLLAGAVAAAGVAVVLDGSAGLRSRPMGRIIAPLRQMGVTITAAQDDTAPLILTARPAGQRLQGLNYNLPVASAQVKSCLLLAGLSAATPSLLVEPGPSRDHTERMLAAMGVQIESRPVDNLSNASLTRLTPPAAPLLPLQMTLPGDISAAAFLIVAAAITPGSQITIQCVGLNPTRTGLIEALQAMGADIRVTPTDTQAGEPVGDLEIRYAPLHGGAISGPLVVRMIDEFPAFAIAAAYAQGETIVSDAQELRYKESDRISDLCAELRKLGVKIEEKPDGFMLQGGQVQGGVVDPHGDHRLAMSLAVAGLAAQGPVRVVRAGILRESFPSFLSVMDRLGVTLEANF